MNERRSLKQWWLLILKILTSNCKQNLNNSLFQTVEVLVFHITYLERVFNQSCENTQYAVFPSALVPWNASLEILAGRLQLQTSFMFFFWGG